MSDPQELPEIAPRSTPLRDAIRRVRIVNTDQADGLADLRDTERARLELLADDLADLIAEVPDDLDFFAFALSTGETPRLWIDITCHVALGRDRRTYRLLKDTRVGRTILHETADRGEMATRISDYVAERVIDRQRAIEGDWIELKKAASRPDPVARPENVPSASSDVALAPANEDRPNAGRPPEAEVSGRRSGGVKWVAFALGLLIGAGALAGVLMAQGRI